MVAGPVEFGEGAIALAGATVIDGTGATPRSGAVIVISKERIAYVGDRTGVRLLPQAKVLDLTGRWVVPGFIDTHAHVPTSSGTESFLAQLVAFGVTAIRVPGDDHVELLVELRDRIERGALIAPRMRTAGVFIDDRDKGWGNPTGPGKVGTEAEIREVVRRDAALKVDFIKLYVGLPPALVKAAIEEAHEHGLRVLGHLGRTTWTEAAEFGIDSLAHSWYCGLAHGVVPQQYREEFRDFYIPNRRFNPTLFRKWREVVDPGGQEVAQLASLLCKRHVEVHPNLVLGEAVTWGDDPAVLERLEPDFAPPEDAASWRRGRHLFSSYWPPEATVEAKRALPVMVQVIGVFHRHGVLLTAGTDYLNPWMTPGVAFHRELELLASAGIPPLEVLRIATRNGAETLGILQDAGTIETGKRADLVTLTADPLAAISNTRKIERVFLRGQSFEPAQLLPRREQAGGWETRPVFSLPLSRDLQSHPSHP
jgi:imidazolonepropionase-like amidohydrolase